MRTTHPLGLFLGRFDGILSLDCPQNAPRTPYPAMVEREVWPDGESLEEVEVFRDRLAVWLATLLKESGQLNGDAGGLETTSDWEKAPQLASLHLSCSLFECRGSPCVSKAVATSLLEVCMYHRAAHGPEGQLRRGLSTYLRSFDQGGDALAELRSVAAGLIGSDSEMIAVMPEEATDGAVWGDCVQAIDDALELPERIRSLLERLRSREFLLPVAKLRLEGRGRRPGHLLQSLCGYLRAVEVEWQEIAVRLKGAPEGSSNKDLKRRVNEAKRLSDRFAKATESRTFDLADD